MAHGVLTVVLACTLVTGCSRSTPPEMARPGEPPLAVVDGRPITAEHLSAELARWTRDGRSPEPRKVLANLIERQRLIARAKQLGLDQDPEVLRSMDSVLIARLKERELQPRLLGSERDRPSAGNPSTEETAAPPSTEQVRLAWLRIEVPAKASPERLKSAMDRLEGARDAVAKLPADTLGFGELAAAVSDDPGSRLLGGDLGWLHPDASKYHLDATALTAGFALQQPGQLSPIVRGEDAFYLLRLIARRPTPATPRAVTRDLARHHDHLNRRRSIEESFAEEIRQKVPVTVNTSVVDAFVARQPAVSSGSPPRL